jgi:ribosomal protein S3AE
MEIWKCVVQPGNLSNQLIEFFRRIYPLKRVFYKYFERKAKAKEKDKEENRSPLSFSL